jgi:hypothetical protein
MRGEEDDMAATTVVEEMDGVTGHLEQLVISSSPTFHCCGTSYSAAVHVPDEVFWGFVTDVVERFDEYVGCGLDSLRGIDFFRRNVSRAFYMVDATSGAQTFFRNIEHLFYDSLALMEVSQQKGREQVLRACLKKIEHATWEVDVCDGMDQMSI